MLQPNVNGSFQTLFLTNPKNLKFLKKLKKNQKNNLSFYFGPTDDIRLDSVCTQNQKFRKIFDINFTEVV